MVTVHNFSYGLLNPLLGYAMSCLGAFLGLRCVTRARAHTGIGRLRWLAIAAISLGAAGIWAMHFIAMLGFTIPGQTILYNVPITIVSMLIAIAVVGVGLYIVCNGDGSLRPLLLGGVIVGIGVAVMHYLGMAAMSMPDTMRYNIPLFVVSMVIAIVAGTAALWAGTQVRGIGTTVIASLIMGVAVSGMHYTGMAAMQVYGDAKTSAGSMAAMSGATATSFLIPLLAGISLLTFALTLTISLSPSEDEIHEDALLQYRMDTEFSGGLEVRPGGGMPPVPPVQNAGRVTTPRDDTSDAFTPYAKRNGYDSGSANGYSQANGYGQGGTNGYDHAEQPPLPLPTRRSPRSGNPGDAPPRTDA
jgi:NO-binding membrane sensor protein with MHYT domain